MTVYVDDANKPRNRRGYYVYSHLAADTLDELHAFAGTLGFKTFHAHPEHPHYDVNQWQRTDAITCGAVPVRPRELLTIAKCAKLNHNAAHAMAPTQKV